MHYDCLREPTTKAARFRQAHRCQILVQDVMLVLAQLWKAGIPFAAVVPNWDETVLATFKRLPCTSWTGGTACTLVHTSSEASVPEVLFGVL